MIVLIGDFIDKQSVVQMSSNEDIQCVFDSLFDAIRGFERLASKVKFLLIPGPNDPGSDMMAPQFALPDFILDNSKLKKDHTILGTNPCRLSFYGKEIVISRYEYYTKFKKNALSLGGDNAKMSSLDQTPKPNFTSEAINVGTCVLRQGNLYPFTCIDQPVYWEHHEALNITPHPDVLVLADTAIQFVSDQDAERCIVTNPGNFSGTK